MIGRVVLREQVKEAILERILTGEYAPGERLVETRIAEEFGVSQAPVREALRDLELLRFVESEAFRGARVRAVSQDELLEIYPVRQALERVAAESAAARLTERDLEALGQEVEGMTEAADRGDLHDQAEHDVAFHRIIVDASGNSILGDVWRSLRVEARTLITAVKTGVSGREIADMHRPILEALRTRDPDASGAAISEHFAHFATLLKGAEE
jgi:DNA-binding GntR family transcriptional regulator